MARMYRSPSLENKEIMALYGRGEDFAEEEDCDAEDFEEDLELCEDGKGGRGVRSSVSLEIYGLQREQQVHFSNQEYYRRLEELKSAHLRNMAELERMYISYNEEMHREDGDGRLRTAGGREARHSVRRLQRINSQEELDFHDSSSGSDQSELSGEDSARRTGGQGRTFGRENLLSPEEMMTLKHYRLQPKGFCPKAPGQQLRQTGAGGRPGSKVTVPKPFQMMLREEERKRHKVRTRSEIELENSLLRRELEELRECQKKFRAAPAPAHTHLPLYDAISRRRSQRPARGAGHKPPQQPFHFLERERRKREAKIVAELSRLGPKEGGRAFRARPMPGSVYGARRAGRRLERDGAEGQSETGSDPEPDACPYPGAQRGPAPKTVKKQIELSIEMVQEREWSYVDPLRAGACSICSGPELPPPTGKSDYISV